MAAVSGEWIIEYNGTPTYKNRGIEIYCTVTCPNKKKCTVANFFSENFLEECYTKYDDSFVCKPNNIQVKETYLIKWSLVEICEHIDDGGFKDSENTIDFDLEGDLDTVMSVLNWAYDVAHRELIEFSIFTGTQKNNFIYKK